MKKYILLFILSFCILLAGCKEKDTVPYEEPVRDTVQEQSVPVDILPEGPLPVFTSSDPIIVTDDTVLTAKEFSFGMQPQNFILIKSGASVVLEDISLDKVDDGSAEPVKSETGNALLLGEDSSSITIRKSILSGEAPYSSAVCLSGNGSSANITDSGLSVTGSFSDALHLLGGTASISDSTLISEGESGAAIRVNSGMVSCKKTLATTSGSESAFAVILNSGILSATDSTFNGKMFFEGENEFTLHNSSVTGTFCSGSDISSVVFRLTEYSSLISNCDDSACGIQLFIDKTCSWELQSDIYLDTLTLEDPDFSIIKDNGFSVYYNSENTENAWLEGRTYMLQDGGCIAPLI